MMASKKVRRQLSFDNHQICYLVRNGMFDYAVVSLVEYFKTSPPGYAGIILVPASVSSTDISTLAKIEDVYLQSTLHLYCKRFESIAKTATPSGFVLYNKMKLNTSSEISDAVEYQNMLNEKISIGSDVKANIPWFNEINQLPNEYMAFIQSFNVYFLICSHIYKTNDVFYMENLKTLLMNGQYIRNKLSEFNGLFITKADEDVNPLLLLQMEEIVSWVVSVNIKFKDSRLRDIANVLDRVFLRNESDDNIQYAKIKGNYYQPMYPQLFPGMWRKLTDNNKTGWDHAPEIVENVVGFKPTHMDYVMIIRTPTQKIEIVSYFSRDKPAGEFLSSRFTDKGERVFYKMTDLYKKSWQSHHYEWMIKNTHRARVYIWTRKESSDASKMTYMLRNNVESLELSSTVIALDVNRPLFDYFDVVAEGKLGCRLLSMDLKDVTFNMNSTVSHYYEMKGHRRVDYDYCVGSIYPCEFTHYSGMNIPIIKFDGSTDMLITTSIDSEKATASRHKWCKLDMVLDDNKIVHTYYRKGELSSNPKLPYYIPIYTDTYRSYVIYKMDNNQFKLVEQDSKNGGINQETSSPFIVYSNLGGTDKLDFPLSVYKRVGDKYHWKVSYSKDNSDADLKLKKQDLIPLLYAASPLTEPKSFRKILRNKNVHSVDEKAPSEYQIQRYITDWFFPDDGSALSFLRACGYLMTRKNMYCDFKNIVPIKTREEAHIHRNPVLDKFMYMNLNASINLEQIIAFFEELNNWLLKFFGFHVILFKVPESVPNTDEYITKWDDITTTSKFTRTDIGLHQYYLLVMTKSARKLTDGHFAYSLWFRENKDVDGRKSYFGDLIDFLPYDNQAIAREILRSREDTTIESPSMDVMEQIMKDALSGKDIEIVSEEEANVFNLDDPVTNKLDYEYMKSRIDIGIFTMRYHGVEKFVNQLAVIFNTVPMPIVKRMFGTLDSDGNKYFTSKRRVELLKAMYILYGLEEMDMNLVNQMTLILLVSDALRLYFFSTGVLNLVLARIAYTSIYKTDMFAILNEDLKKIPKPSESIKNSYIQAMYMLSDDVSSKSFKGLHAQALRELKKFKFFNKDDIPPQEYGEYKSPIANDAKTFVNSIYSKDNMDIENIIELMNSISLKSEPYYFVYCAAFKNKPEERSEEKAIKVGNELEISELMKQFAKFIE